MVQILKGASINCNLEHHAMKGVVCGRKLRRLEKVMHAMGKVMAWAHLRSGGRQGSAIADEWIAFAARGDWRSPLLEYADGYARQVVTDWNEFCESPLIFDPLDGNVNKSVVSG